MFAQCAQINPLIRVTVIGLEHYPHLIQLFEIHRTPQIFFDHQPWNAPVNEWIVAQALRNTTVE
jgi:hypothetical protein